MKALYDSLSNEVSKITTRKYSTSFSLGISLLDRRIREAVYSIYGFVRLADEIVDSFHGYDRRRLLERFSGDTWQAIREGISVNPILHSYQQTVRRYGIGKELIRLFFESMEMDLERIRYDGPGFAQYIVGSAEVVGLMCLHVFTEGDAQLYDELKPPAMRLGAAFQKVNFLRDMKDDYQLLGRVYFPDLDLDGFTPEIKMRIEAEIRRDFAEAFRGIRRLPASSKGGVYLAYLYYHSLFVKIKRLPAHRILAGRIRLSRSHKFRLMVRSLVHFKLKKI